MRTGDDSPQMLVPLDTFSQGIHQIALVFGDGIDEEDNEEGKTALYIDGVLQASSFDLNSPRHVNGFTVGKGFRGSLCDLRVYSSYLKAETVCLLTSPALLQALVFIL